MAVSFVRLHLCECFVFVCVLACVSACLCDRCLCVGTCVKLITAVPVSPVCQSSGSGDDGPASGCLLLLPAAQRLFAPEGAALGRQGQGAGAVWRRVGRPPSSSSSPLPLAQGSPRQRAGTLEQQRRLRKRVRGAVFPPPHALPPILPPTPLTRSILLLV